MQANATPFSTRGRGSEEDYFRRLEAERAEARRCADERAGEVAALAAALGLADASRAEALTAFGIRADNAAAFAVLPLVEVAWADGRVDPDERWRVLEAATRHGVELGRPAHALLESWLERRPADALFRAWHRHAAEDGAPGAAQSRALVESAASVASAAGGLLGFGPISRSERSALAGIERSLAGCAASGAAWTE
jgi:hypothetical protein